MRHLAILGDIPIEQARVICSTLGIVSRVMSFSVLVDDSVVWRRICRRLYDFRIQSLRSTRDVANA